MPVDRAAGTTTRGQRVLNRTPSQQPYLRPSRGAFTLVELLVVVSIIALLIAILLPSLRNARSAAKRTQCLHHIRGIAIGSLTYAADDPHENGIPVAVDQDDPVFDDDPYWARYGNYGFGGKSGIGGGSIHGVPQDRPYDWTNGLGSAQRPLNRVLYKSGLPVPSNAASFDDHPDTLLDLNLYLCPADRGYRGNHYREWGATNLSSYDFFGTSYAANVFWTGPNIDTCTMGSNSPYIRSLSRVPAPTDTLLYVENVGRYSWNHRDPGAVENGGPFPNILPAPEYPEALGGPEWHGRGWFFNAAFSDGHAAYIQIKSYREVDPYPTNMGGKCGEGEYCKWIMIRGRGWRLDCLPVPPVETRHPCPDEGRPSQDGEDIAGWVD